MADLFYQGTRLRWTGHGEFKATSGLKGHQNASEQTSREHGPIPEGEYWFPVHVAKTPIATMIAPGQLDRNDGIEFVSPLIVHGANIYNLTAWGLDRVRLHVTRIDDPKLPATATASTSTTRPRVTLTAVSRSRCSSSFSSAPTPPRRASGKCSVSA